jgi:hypothetical protein
MYKTPPLKLHSISAIKRIAALLCITTPVLSLIGCSSGSSGGNSVTPITDTITIDPTSASDENLNWGLEEINASTLNNTGGTGTDQLVAIIDTGIDHTHSEFDGKIHTASFTYNGSSTVDESNDHGTHVAGIIAAKQNGFGDKGIAYDSSILSLGLISDPDLTMTQVADGFAYADSYGAKVLNNSWVIGSQAVNSITTADATAAYGTNIVQTGSQLTNNDSVFVWAAGNDADAEVNIMAGLPYHFPELKAGWVAVVAINQNGSIADFSNHCGLAADWCLAAPGADIYSTSHNGKYGTYSGTSVAAPHVSGGLAALKSAFPNLSNQQLLTRILTTANKTGIYANSAIYGNGLLDLAAASAPVGDLKLTADSSQIDAALASSSIVVLPKALLADLGIDTSSANVLLVDSFQSAPFWAKASQFIEEANAPILSIKWSSLFAAKPNRAEEEALSIGQDLALSLNKKTGTDEISGFNLHLGQNNNKFSMGAGSGDAMSANILGLSHQEDWLTNSDEGYLASGYQYHPNINDNIRLNIGVATKNKLDPNNENNQSHSLKTTAGDINTALLGGVAMALENNAELSLQLSAGSIDNMHSQASATGAFAIDDAALSSVKLGLTKKIGDGTLSASLGHANIHTNDDNNSLINLPENIRLTTAKVAYALTDNARHGLRIGASLSKASGEDLELKLPNNIDTNGNISYASYRSDIGNLYDQQAVELNYNFLLNKNITLGMETFWQHANGGDSNFGAIAGFELRD